MVGRVFLNSRWISPAFCLVMFIGFAGVLHPGAPPQGGPRIVVGPNVQVSAKNGARAHWEVRMAADPNDANHLIACSFIQSTRQDTFHTVVYSSADAGRSWAPTLDSGVSILEGDPDCIFGLNGTAYFVTLATLHFESNPSPVTLIYRSSDDGQTWQKPLALSFPLDREYLAVDRTTGKYRGRIYLQANLVGRSVDDPQARKPSLSVFRSLDGGKTFLPPVVLPPSSTHAPFGNGNAVVLPDGSYAAVFPEWSGGLGMPADTPADKPVGWIKMVRSDDGGQKFSAASVISPWFECRSAPVDSVSGLPQIAVDDSGGPFQGRLYAVWADQQSGHCDIRFSYSTDEGTTWAPSIVINDEPNRNSPSRSWDQDMPVVAVNNRGVVGIEWYDRRNSADDFGWWPRFTASLDGGETFLPSVKLSPVPERHTAGENLPLWVYGMGGGAGWNTPGLGGPGITIEIDTNTGEPGGGDTGGMAADANGVFHPLWVDNRTGILQLWTASVTVQGSVIRNGSEQLANLRDVTKLVTLQYSNVTYDPKSGAVAFDATMTNTSHTAIRGPIRLRVIRLSPGSGTVEIVNADNQATGSGAIWDFTALAPGGVLRPGEKTGTKRFSFRFAGLRLFRSGTARGFPGTLLCIEGRVFADGVEKEP